LGRNLKAAQKNIRELTLVRSQVKYAPSAQSSWLLQDIIELEKLQQRGARFVIRSYQQTAIMLVV